MGSVQSPWSEAFVKQNKSKRMWTTMAIFLTG